MIIQREQTLLARLGHLRFNSLQMDYLEITDQQVQAIESFKTHCAAVQWTKTLLMLNLEVTLCLNSKQADIDV